MKPRARAPHAIAAARAVKEATGIREPEDLDLDALLASFEMFVLHGALPKEDGHKLRSRRVSVVRLREEHRGTARERFTKAHELGHGILHPDIDQLARCTGGSVGVGDEERALEDEADAFAAELILGEDHVRAHMTRMEAAGGITFEGVSALAALLGASFQATGIRLTEFATTAIALVHSTCGTIDWAAESRKYLGKIVSGRQVAKDTVAARLRANPQPGIVRAELPGRSWGTYAPILEEAVVTDYGSVMSWIRWLRPPPAG